MPFADATLESKAMRHYLKLALLVAIVWTAAMLVMVAGVLLLDLLGLLAVGGLLAAWAGHTLTSQAVFDDFEHALRIHDISMKEAAITVGISPQQFSNGWHGDGQVSFSRLAAHIPPKVWVTFAELQIQRYTGGRVLSLDICELIQSVKALTEKVETAKPSDRRVA